MQKVLYFDGTVFKGEMDIDEESNFAFKEGPGKLKRGGQHSYYTLIKGVWSRGVLHGKRIEYTFNLKIFPKGYYINTYPKAVSLKCLGEVKKGIQSGKSVVIIDGKEICKTVFHDLIEVATTGHPVGRQNIITMDLAPLNCFLNLLVIVMVIFAA